MTASDTKIEAVDRLPDDVLHPMQGIEYRGVIYVREDDCRKSVQAVITRKHEQVKAIQRDLAAAQAEHERKLAEALDTVTASLQDALTRERAAREEAERDGEKWRSVNTPEIHDFVTGVQREAIHQVERWGAANDRAKRDADWFWLVGYLAGKALHSCVAGDHEKALHHCISTAAALYNWHCAIKGTDGRMCPGKSDLQVVIEDAFGPDAARTGGSDR